MNCVSCDTCVYRLGLFVVFPGVLLSSRVTGACPVTTDLIMRVNVRTTTTTLCNSRSLRDCRSGHSHKYRITSAIQWNIPKIM